MLDLLKSITSICLTLFSFVVLIWGLGHSIILGFVLAFLCLAASVLVLQSVSSDIWSEVKQQQDLKRERQLYRDYEKNRYGYICPCCGYPAGERVDNKEEGYTYRCRNCRYIWQIVNGYLGQFQVPCFFMKFGRKKFKKIGKKVR